MLIRDATQADLPALLAIRNDVIATTTAIYDDELTTLDSLTAWFDERGQHRHPVRIAEVGGEVAGYSSFAMWRPRFGHRYTVEHSAHVRADRRRQGLGRALVEGLFPCAAALGMHVMIAHIDSEAVGSCRLQVRALAGPRRDAAQHLRRPDAAFTQRPGLTAT
ncbi:MAG: GNAT family N-acetyltransferase [Steroidobacteraceae bacterium]